MEQRRSRIWARKLGWWRLMCWTQMIGEGNVAGRAGRTTKRALSPPADEATTTVLHGIGLCGARPVTCALHGPSGTM
jgi:hypothetical protein